MNRISLRFPLWARWITSSILLLSLVTGVMWYVLGRWGDVEGEFGPEKHPWLTTLTKLHGAGAFASLIAIGAILGAHVPIGWRTHRSRISGLLLIGLLSTTILTAYGLYYSGSTGLREILILLHLGSGLGLPVLLAVHILWGCRKPGLPSGTSTPNGGFRRMS